mmetsp:Transcript_18469/g.42768  ORF Transcript_18469/g.42768 Transcript_18469/m.42768 type:complete len:202 (-) Transcript_18469:74-679(-)
MDDWFNGMDFGCGCRNPCEAEERAAMRNRMHAVESARSMDEAPPCGVGIVFKASTDRKEGLVVDGMVPFGSAQRNGILQRGDVLTKVDGVDVIGKPVSFVGSLLLGPPGTSVTLEFTRQSQVSTSQWTPLTVSLMRSPVQPRIGSHLATSVGHPINRLGSSGSGSWDAGSPYSSPQKVASPTRGRDATSAAARRMVYTTGT